MPINMLYTIMYFKLGIWLIINEENAKKKKREQSAHNYQLKCG